MGDALPAIGGAGGGLGYDYYQALITNAIEQRGAYRLPSPEDLQVATTSPWNGDATHDIVADPPDAMIRNQYYGMENELTAWGTAMAAASYIGANSMWGMAARIAGRVGELQQAAPGFRYRHFGDTKTATKSGRRGASKFYIYNLNKRSRKYPYRKKF